MGKELQVAALENGTAIDHIPTRELFKVVALLQLQKLDNRITIGNNLKSSKMGAKSLFALDNLWDGLGALTVIMPNVKYFFGKMTMYPSYVRKGRDMILFFLKKHFDDHDHLIIPTKPLKIETDEEELRQLFCEDSFRDDYKILNREILAK